MSVHRRWVPRMPVEASLPGQGVSAMGKYLAVGIVSAAEAVGVSWEAADGVCALASGRVLTR